MSHAERANELLEEGMVHRPDRWVDEITLKANPNVLYMSELLIGHQDAAVDFFDETVERIKDNPPDVIIAGAFLQGDFKHTQKPRRVTLEHGMESMTAQFALAREKIDALIGTGATVIYNMGADDHRIAYDYTVEVFREMQNLAKEVGYASQDKMRAHPEWQKHLDFQNRVVFPYCLDKGRSLNGIGEYFDLLKKYEQGKDLSPKDFIVTDDANVQLKNHNIKVRSYLGFSPEPQYQNPLQPAQQYMENRLAHGEELPDSLVMQHNHELTGVNYGDSWLLSTGALFDPRNFMETRGSKTDARGDISRRLHTTRRRVHAPSAVSHEAVDGRDIFTVYNERLNEKAASIGRMSVLLTCDHQVGSITARPDILLKELGMFRDRIDEIGSVAIQMAGDMSHGRNYPDFPAESQSTGLMAMDSQLRFNERLWRGAFDGMTKEQWDAFHSVVIEPGNHEWNSGTDKWHGYSFVDNHRLAFEVMLARAGYTDKEIKEKIKTHDAVTTPKGEVAKSFTGIERYGDYGFLNQHFLLAKGGKGNGGSPIYQTPNYVNGLADLAKDLDLFGVGHWHHGSFGLFGNKLGFIAPAKAGQSGYEIYRGYRPGIGSLLIHLGGDQPVQLEYVSEKALNEYQINEGAFSVDALKQAGFKTDRGHNPNQHGLRMHGAPKSALQKAVIALEQDISNRTDTMGYF